MHRGALLSDGHIRGKDLICGVHEWDYCYKTGVSSYNPAERQHRFHAWVADGAVWVDEDEIAAWEVENPQAYDRDSYQGLYKDLHGGPEEPHYQYIQHLAEHGLTKVGHHGRVAAMGVPRDQLPQWEDIQLLTAQLYRVPLLDDHPVGTEVVIGPNAKKPLRLDIPLLVSDMSFGALSEEAKIALAKGAEMAGTGICSGEGGMLPEEQANNSRYLYELASARFGFSIDKLQQVQAFHFKCGQGAKTGTGGHLPGAKVKGKIAEVRGLQEGEPAVSPPRFPDWESIDDYRDFAAEVRETTGGIPIGVKLSAQHIERDIEASLKIGVDYIILDGRGGGTGAAPLLFRDNISVPTIPALARARRFLDESDRRDVTLVITGGLRIPADFVKALALGADAIAVSNSAIQAIGCLGMRACHTDNCPVGIATQKPELRQRLEIQKGALQLNSFFRAATELMQVMARACGHDHLNQLSADDLTTWQRDMAHLTGIGYGGVSLD
jgi:glutamate synthase domain-containing protein 2